MNVLLLERRGPLAIASLNKAATLNALDLDMFTALNAALKEWAADASVKAVILQSSLEKAFSAGGDVRQVTQQSRGLTLANLADSYAWKFFSAEYGCDLAVAEFPKPLLTWGHGLVFGGGWGLFAGGSCRVLTPQSQLAMPEISIGLYPDVGASAYMQKFPGLSALFCTLTGARLNARDALYANAADYCLPHEARESVLLRLERQRWADYAPLNRSIMRKIVGEQNDPALARSLPSLLETHQAWIDTHCAGDDFPAIYARLAGNTQHSDPWLAENCQRLASGSPTSAWLTWRLFGPQRQPMNLKDALARDFVLSINASLGNEFGHEFAEGVRAQLIDKDRTPKWKPAQLKDVTPQLLDSYFQERWKGKAP